MKILSYFCGLVIMFQLIYVLAIKKEYQDNMMGDQDGMKIIMENSHFKKNKLHDTLSLDNDKSSKKEYFDQRQVFDYFSLVKNKKSADQDEDESDNEEDVSSKEDDEIASQEVQSEEKKSNKNKEDNTKSQTNSNSENKGESQKDQDQLQQKQLVLQLKGSDSQIIQKEDGEIYFLRYDSITQTTQMMNMNKIKEVDFKNSKMVVDTSSSDKQKLQKYTIPTYDPFEWFQVLSEGEIPQRRGGHTLISVGQTVILFGGCLQDIECFNDLYFYDIMELSWSTSKIFGEPPSPRSGHSATLVGSYLFIFGGSNEHGILSDLHRLNLASRMWEQFEFEGPKPPGRTNHKAVLDNQGRIVFFGGFTVQGYSNDVYFLDLVNLRWVKPLINGESPRPRENFSMNLIRDSYVWIFGGYCLGGETNDLWQLDVENMRWTKISESFGTKPIERQGHQMVLHGKLLYTLGGCNYKEQRCFNDVYQLNIDDLTWTKLDFVLENTLKERDNYGLTLMGTNLYLFGGCQMMEKCYNDFLVMNITDICPKNCSGRGVCRNSRCQCYEGFFGEQCEIEMHCEYNCSNRGICGTDGNCKCYSGFAGKICELYIPCPSNCTSIDNGLCQSNGLCQCNEGYKGLACEVGKKGLLDIEVKCPKNCNNRGKCNEITGICICEDGYGDLDCSLTIEEWEQQKKEKEQKKEEEELNKKQEELKKKEGKEEVQNKQGDEVNKDSVINKSQNPNDKESDEDKIKETNLDAEQDEQTPQSDQNTQQQQDSSSEESSAQSDQDLTKSTGELEEGKDQTPSTDANQDQKRDQQITESINQESDLSEQDLSKSEEIAKLIHMALKANQKQEQVSNLSDCENSCSFNGVCYQQECYCKPGFTGEDCSAYKISQLHKGIKVVKLIFYIPLFFIIGIIIGYFYIRQAQSEQEEQEFGEIEDYKEEQKRQSIIALNMNQNEDNKKLIYIEDNNDEEDSVSFIKARVSNSEGSFLSEHSHKQQDIQSLQQLQKQNSQGSPQININNSNEQQSIIQGQRQSSIQPSQQNQQQSNIFIRNPNRQSVENPFQKDN
ncbi:hypothetical protein ABPG72_006898 [Tetrahymena utriculariae]